MTRRASTGEGRPHPRLARWPSGTGRGPGPGPEARSGTGPAGWALGAVLAVAVAITAAGLAATAGAAPTTAAAPAMPAGVVPAPAAVVVWPPARLVAAARDVRGHRGGRPCPPSALAASLSLTAPGSLPTSLAGMVVLHNVSRSTCILSGVPSVSAVAAGGGALPLHELRSEPRRSVPVVLAPAGQGGQADRAGTAGVSITWSEWTCEEGSFSLAVRFPGWPVPVTVPYGTTAGYGGPRCTTTGDQTLYVGPVGRPEVG